MLFQLLMVGGGMGMGHGHIYDVGTHLGNDRYNARQR
jgi:hypothetical protein